MAEWRTLGTEVMADAQKALGLSDERLARQIPVSTRTWIRWKQRGQVPLHALPHVADVLGLEIEYAQQNHRVVVDGGPPVSDEEASTDAVLRRLDLLQGEVEELAQLVRDLLSRSEPSAPPSRR